MRISKLKKAALEMLNKDGYLTREQLSEKYKISRTKIWRLIKHRGLPLDEELDAIKEADFIKWKKNNVALIADRRKLNLFGRVRKDKK